MSTQDIKLYHVSSVKFDSIKSKAMLNPKDSTLQDYDNRVSLLLTYVTPDEIRRYVKRGFKQWDMSEAYIYIVNPNTILEYNYAKMQSTPEQIAYDRRCWDKFMADVSDDEFLEARKVYSTERDAYLLAKYKIPPTGKVMDYLSNPLAKNWRKHDWINYNLMYGNKNQYASYTPHLQVAITTPIEFEEVIKLI